ncbi:MAG: hypothetical protein F6K41_14550 [Symploca sp. SIO3E6]|nr:hypothetical protein [Caldora sp. SIO3E6]
MDLWNLEGDAGTRGRGDGEMGRWDFYLLDYVRLNFYHLLLPPAFCLLPSASCLLPPASCLLPSAFCLKRKKGGKGKAFFRNTGLTA